MAGIPHAPETNEEASEGKEHTLAWDTSQGETEWDAPSDRVKKTLPRGEKPTEVLRVLTRDVDDMVVK
jgi:hypothetical protein